MKSGFGGSSNYAKSVEVLDKNVNIANNSSINDSASGDEDILAMLTKPTNQFGLTPTVNAPGTSNYKMGTGLANVAENIRGDADNVSEDEDDEPTRATYPSLYQRSAVAAQGSNSDNYYDSRRPMDSVESHIDSTGVESQDDESNESDSSDSSSREDLEIVESSSTYGKEGTDLDTPRSVDGSSLPGTVDGKMSNMNKAVDGSIINTAGQKNVMAPTAGEKVAAEVVGGGGCFGCGGSSSKKKSAAAAAAASKPAALNAAASPTTAKPLIASAVPVAGVNHIDDIMSEDAAAGAMSEDNDDISHPSTSYPKALPTVTESLAECDDEDDDEEDDDDDDDDDDDEDDEDLEAESVSAVDSESVPEEGTTPLSAAAVSVPSTATAPAFGATAVPIASSGNDEYTAKHGYSGSASGSTGAIAATAVGATAAVGAVGAGMAYGATAVPIAESASHDEYTAKHGSSNPMSVSTPAVAAPAAGATAAAGAGVAYGATAVPVAGSSNHDEYAVKYAPSNSMSSSTGAVVATAAGATAAVGAAGAGIAYGATAAPKAVLSGGIASSGMSGDVIPPAGPAVRAAAASASVPLSSASAPGGGMSAGAGGAGSIPAARVAGTPLAVPTGTGKGTGKIPDAATLAKPATAKICCPEDDYGNDHQCCCPAEKNSAVAVGGVRGAQGGSSMGGKGNEKGGKAKPAPKPLPTKGLKYDGCTKTGFCCFVPFCVKPWQARKYKPNSLPRSSPNYRHPITGKA